MKILIYGLNYHPELTGVGKYTGEMAEWLAKRGHEVKVVAAPPYYPEWKVQQGYTSLKYLKETHKSVSIVRCPIYVPENPTGPKRIAHLLSFTISSFPVLLANVFWRPQVIFALQPTFFTAPSVCFVKLFTRSRTWLHIQDFEIDAAFDLGIIKNKKFKNYVLLFERYILSKYDRLSTISFKMLDKLREKNKKNIKQLYFPNWVDCDQIFPIDPSDNAFRHSLGFSTQDRVALYSGNLGAKQGLEILIDVAKKLENHPNMKIIICGEGPALPLLKEKAGNLKNVKFLPLQPVDRLNELLSCADVHLLPQRADVEDLVMPSKLTGMLASGRPVLAVSREGTQVEQVVRLCGYALTYPDTGLFYEKLKQLFENDEFRQNLGHKARSYAIENINKTDLLSKFEREILELI